MALIDYAIAAVEASAGTSEFWVGALPITREPKPLTTAQRDALARGRKEGHAQRKRESEAWDSAAKKRSRLRNV